MRGVDLVRFCLLALLSLSAPRALGLDAEAAVEIEEAPAEEGATREGGSQMFVAAGWCEVVSGTEGETDQAVGCDLGVGFALASWKASDKRYASVVVVLGRKTLGAGLSWTIVGAGEDGPKVSFAVGVVAPYDDGGVYSERWAPAVGTTVGF